MLNEIAKEIAETVKESVQFGIKQLSLKYEERIAALESQIAAQESMKSYVDEAISKIKFPEYKEYSESDILDIAKQIIPEKGEDGKDGASVTLDDVKPLIAEAVAAIPAPKDGESAEIDYDKITEIVNETIAEAVSNINIPIPQKGEDGKDAIDLEIAPGIDESKSYRRGTYATYNGGLWRAYEKTNGMRGWECVVSGIKEMNIEYDGVRGLTVNIEKSGGEFEKKDFVLPVPVSKGMWRPGAYQKGDIVILSGSSWICEKDTEDRPGTESKDWLCFAKKGGTGKSNFDIAKEAGFTGSKQEWIDKTGILPKVKL